MKIVGGEIELKKSAQSSYITDSGRSSLRLILKSLDIKHLLVPNYLCAIIVNVLSELEISYSFYDINDDLSIDTKSLESREFDAIYIINYFGQRDKCLEGLCDADVLIIEDSVFLPVVEKPECLKKWAGFNSFRKISNLADGSIVKSTFELNRELISTQEAKFPKVKYAAKNIKYEYLNDALHSEDVYLKLFQESEDMLDMQSDIYSISNESLSNLFNFYASMEKEYRIRNSNFMTLDKYLHEYGVKIETKFPSFYVICVDCRDSLRKFLFKNDIFLPIHWPNILHLDNSLYGRLLSIPVDSRYDENDMLRIAELIRAFMEIDKEGRG